MVNKKTKSEKVTLVMGAFGSMKDCSGLVEDVITPKEGGIFTKYRGCSYLFKGFADRKVVEAIAVPKKLLFIFTRLTKSLSMKFFLVVLFFFNRKIFINVFDACLEIIHSQIRNHILKLDRYCIYVIEFRKSFDGIINGLKEEEYKDRTIRIGDTTCMTLEYDAAYKFRVQDVLPNLDIEKLKVSPSSEIGRLFDILIERESYIEMKTKWRKIKKIAVLVLKISKKARKYVILLLESIDLDKIKLDEADWYYCLRRPDYRYGDVAIEERMREVEKIDKEKEHKIPKIEFKSKEE